MNKSVFVTGATNGTGYAIAKRFATEGYDVFITSRKKESAEAAAAKLAAETGRNVVGYGLPAYDKQAVEEAFADIRARGYLLDALVCNAANLGVGQDTLTVDVEEFMDVIHTNIGWNFMMAQAAAKQMKEKGKGAIVFINSNTAYRAIPNRCAYSASKGGVLGMARAMALDLGKYGIRINCVLPGMIKTDRWENNTNNIRSAPSVYTPIGDIAEYDDIANAAWYMGSDQSRNTTGAELVVDGGNMIQLYPIIPENK